MGNIIDMNGLVIQASKFIGEFSGSISGGVTGDVTGDLTGDIAGVVTNFTIGLAASETTDGMDITITAKDKDGATVAAVCPFRWYISEAASGAGITGDTYSGDVTTVTGTEIQEITSKKVFWCSTAANGIWTGLAVASANPVDQYIVVENPYTGKVVVSAASGTNWEGAV